MKTRLMASIIAGSILLILCLGGAGDPLAPVAEVTPNQILVWRYFPRTPCTITTDNPTCPAGDGIPPRIQIRCRDQAVCNPLSAAERVPNNKKVVATHFYAGEGKLLKVRPGAGSQLKECNQSNGDCPIAWCRWEGMTVGFGKFKNWSDNRDRTALVIVDLADK